MKARLAAATLLTVALSMIPSSQPGDSVRAATAVCGTSCGVERWAVKTLSDAGATSVNMTPAASSVSALVGATAPQSGSGDTRLNSIEEETLSISALLLGFKLETDHDFHLVIEDPQTHDTMIAEIPDPQCSGVCASIAFGQISQARSAFSTTFAATPPSPEYTAVNPPILVTITGVGFFDFYHGQTGVAKNCVELHPVLTIAFPQGAIHAQRVGAAGEPPGAAPSNYHCLPEE